MLYTHTTPCYTHKFKPNSILMYLYYPERCRFRPRTINSSVRRHNRRRLLKYSPNPTSTPTIFKPSADTLQITIRPSNSLKQLLDQSEIKLNRLIECGREAFDDLKTLVIVDGSTGGVVISCRRSTGEFLAALFMSSLVIVFIFKGLFGRRKRGSEALVYKRDRSLGGREVLVGKREGNWGTTPRTTPLSLNDYNDDKKTKNTRMLNRRKEELPQWWPQLLNSGSNVNEMINREEYQRMANRLVRAMMDNKMAGKDISANDIIQLHHICKTFGVRASIETANARDSLYRAAINLVLSYCEIIADKSTSVQINGEDARQFIAGLANNIGLENTRAARMVSAAVAARTRSRILQAWALEVQGKHSEALFELSNICLIHRVFPPSKSSPEMEMVARGLENHLSLEQRELILESLINICGEDTHTSLVEALGLVGVKDSQDNRYA